MRDAQNSRAKGLTMMEMIISLSIIAVLFAVMLPQFKNIENSWASKQATSEALQNGRIIIEYLNRNLTKAARITAVSDPCDTTGYIEFEGNNSITYRCEIGADNIVEFGPVGNLNDLGGPVGKLQFTCYDVHDLDTPITTVGDIRSVNVQITLTNGGHDQTFTTQAYLRTNASSVSALVAHWKLDEGSGIVAADSSPNGHNGTIYNNPAWITGDICAWRPDGRNALYFDGDNDYIDIDTPIPDPMEEVTITFWLKLGSNADSVRSIISNDTFNLGDIHVNAELWGGQNTGIEVSIGDGLGYVVYNIVTQGGPIWVDRWYHVAIVLDSDRAGESYGEIWFDGQLDENTIQDPVTTYPGVVFGNATIGAWNEDGTLLQRFLPGGICDLRIYSQCLNQQQIIELMGTRGGLVGYWTFDDSADVLNDWSGCEYDLSEIVGTTWDSPGARDGYLLFDGADDMALRWFINWAFYNAPGQDATWMGWVNNATGPFIAWSKSCDAKMPGDGWCLYVNDTGNVVFEVHDVGSLVSAQTIDTNWHHLAVTVQSDTGPPGDEAFDTVTMYIDSVPEAVMNDCDVQEGPSGSPESAYLKLGCASNDIPADAPLSFTGGMDNVRIYKRCLSQTDIENIYNQTETCCTVDVGGGGGEVRP
jgi:hypothetical protein